MFSRLTHTMIKVLVASLIVGTILAHFGLTTDQLMQAPGYRPRASPIWRVKRWLGRCPICCSAH